MTDTNAANRDDGLEGKARSRGMINPTEIQMIPRHAGRIARLRLSIEKATANGNTDKVAFLQEELDRRLQSLHEARALLEDI